MVCWSPPPYFKNKKIDFYSIFNEAKIALIAETKHAFYIKSNDNITALMHIGLNTVKLNGKPFDLNVETGQEIKLDTKLVTVDYSKLGDEKMPLEIPIVFDNIQNSNWKFEMVKGVSKAKKGYPIGYLIEVEQVKDSKETSISNQKTCENNEIKNKFLIAAEEIYKLVGGFENFSRFSNCMTRFRLVINDKSLVNIDAIKEINIVKGTNWNGNELQIIIGGDVIKVRDQFEIYLNSIGKNKEILGNNQKDFSHKKGFREKILVPIISCVTPLLPILLACGLFKGIYAILSAINHDIFPSSFISIDLAANKDYIGPFILYIMGDVGITFMGFVIFISIIKYLKEDIVSASAFGLILIGPALYGVYADVTGSTTSWVLLKFFNIGNQSFEYSIQQYGGSLFASALAAITFHIVNKWVKSWMPGIVDIIFRMAIVLLLTTVLIYFVFGPIVTLIQDFLAIIISTIGNLPYGIGVGIFAMLWQPLVLTGAHVPISLLIGSTSFLNQEYASALYFGTVIGTFGQLGAGLGVAIETKNATTRRNSIAGVIPAFLGITEPIIYGINLVRVKPFLWGSFASLFGGIFSGLMGVAYYTSSGLGILAFPGLVPIALKNPSNNPINYFTNEANPVAMNIAWGAVACAITAALSTLFVFFFVKERVNENKEVIKNNKKLLKIFMMKSYYFNNQNIISKIEKFEVHDNKFLHKIYINWLIFKFNIIYLFKIQNNIKKISHNKGISFDTNLIKIKNISIEQKNFFKDLIVNLDSLSNIFSKEFNLSIKNYEKEVVKLNSLNCKVEVLEEKINKSKLNIEKKNNKLIDQKEIIDSKINKLKSKLSKDSIHNTKMNIKLNKLSEKQKNLDQRINNENLKLEKHPLEERKSKLKNDINNLKVTCKTLRFEIEEGEKEILDKSNKYIDDISKMLKDERIEKMNNKYFNAINSVDICYAIKKAKTYSYNKEDIFLISEH